MCVCYMFLHICISVYMDIARIIARAGTGAGIFYISLVRTQIAANAIAMSIAMIHSIINCNSNINSNINCNSNTK